MKKNVLCLFLAMMILLSGCQTISIPSVDKQQTTVASSAFPFPKRPEKKKEDAAGKPTATTPVESTKVTDAEEKKVDAAEAKNRLLALQEVQSLMTSDAYGYGGMELSENGELMLDNTPCVGFTLGGTQDALSFKVEYAVSASEIYRRDRFHDWQIIEYADSVQPKMIHLMLANQGLDHWDQVGSSVDYTQLCYVQWNEIVPDFYSAAAYPKLAETLDELNTIQHDDFTEIFETMKSDISEYVSVDEWFMAFYETSKYYIQRADETIVSIREDFENHMGGVHPNSLIVSINIDPVSGNVLELDDVVTDVPALLKLVGEQLNEKYPEDLVSDAVETLGEYEIENFSWTMDYKGITFYFSPYELASYAAGLLTATVWFDDAPELFDETYVFIPGDGYASALPMWYPHSVDLDENDESTDTLYVAALQSEDDYAYGSLTVYVNDQELTLDHIWFYECSLYYVCTAENSSYLYAELTSENDYSTILVIDLSGGTPILQNTYEGADFSGDSSGESDRWYTYVPTDLSGFMTDHRMEILGTHSGRQFSYADSMDASFVSQYDHYVLGNTDYLSLQKFR